MLEPKVYSVSQINRYIKNIMEKDFILQSLWVKGEISNFKAQSSGHLYFTLKDNNGAIQCVMFKGAAQIMPFEIANGMSVVVCGYVSLYEKTGQYQLYAEIMQPVGVGELHLAYEQLKIKLEAAGLFDVDFKREIAKNPKCIAVITSPTGAAVRDIIKIIKRRNKAVKIAIFPVLVQGEQAPGEIRKAIKKVNQWNMADTIILGRGGGSIEDLWAFNDEGVARAIFASETPVISAVGHETDFTIADFVSDLRASTPSAAAELAVTNIEEQLLHITELSNRLYSIVYGNILNEKQRLAALLKRPVLKSPVKRLYEQAIYMDSLEKRLNREILQILKYNTSNLKALSARIDAASPISALKRGYSLAHCEDGSLLSSVNDIEVGQSFSLTLKNGIIWADVTKRQVEDGAK